MQFHFWNEIRCHELLFCFHVRFFLLFERKNAKMIVKTSRWNPGTAFPITSPSFHLKISQLFLLSIIDRTDFNCRDFLHCRTLRTFKFKLLHLNWRNIISLWNCDSFRLNELLRIASTFEVFADILKILSLFDFRFIALSLIMEFMNFGKFL